MMTQKKLGGSFLIQDTQVEEVFTPEEFSEQHRMIRDLTRDFVDRDVMTQLDPIEAQDWNVTLALFKKAGELSLLAVDIPEVYGGLGLDKTSSMLVAEYFGKAGSFAATVGDHTGIGTLPIVYFGNEAQKKHYLPKFATGEWISSYSLTEPNAGSDALSLKTVARLNQEKTHYVLNGSKIYLTNAGIADVYITFAKIDGEQMTAFIIEKNYPGLTLGKEEKKMGIKGSSTRSLFLENVKVPVENVLGETGKGHKIAFNILNIGRFKLGAFAIGGAKSVITHSIKYANERKQFGKSLSEFGLIKHKLAEMAIRTFVGESMVYRTAGLIDRAVSTLDSTASELVLKSIEEFAIECSIIKVSASEILDYVVDEGVQIFGGYGYIEEYPVARPYRDSRINRIFEGTNEINRLLITDMLLKRAMKGTLPFMAAAQKVGEELLSGSSDEVDTGDPLGEEVLLLRGAKKVALLVAGLAVQKYAVALAEQQEVIAHISDIVIEIYAMESALLRVKKTLQKNSQNELYLSMVRIFVQGAIQRIEEHAKELLAAASEGDMLRIHLTALRKLLKHTPTNAIASRRIVADALIKSGAYTL